MGFYCVRYIENDVHLPRCLRQYYMTLLRLASPSQTNNSVVPPYSRRSSKFGTLFYRGPDSSYFVINGNHLFALENCLAFPPRLSLSTKLYDLQSCKSQESKHVVLKLKCWPNESSPRGSNSAELYLRGAKIARTRRFCTPLESGLCLSGSASQSKVSML